MAKKSETEKAPAAEVAGASRSGDFVTVGCKLPNGLLLQVYDMQEGYEPVLGGGTRKVNVAVRRLEQHKLNGVAVPFGQRPEFLIAGGYAMTSNIPEEFWEKWLHDNRESDLVKNRIVFAHAKADSAADQAKEQKSVLSGLEPIVPDKDKRIPRGTGNLSPISTAETKAA